MHEYDQDRWRIIASKVGNGFSAAACKEKAMELEGLIPPASAPEGDESTIIDEEGLVGDSNSYVYDTSTTTKDTITTTTTDEKEQQQQHFHQQQMHEPRLYQHPPPPPGEE